MSMGIYCSDWHMLVVVIWLIDRWGVEKMGTSGAEEMGKAEALSFEGCATGINLYYPRISCVQAPCSNSILRNVDHRTRVALERYIGRVGT